ncbi:MAG: hypothetical protein ABSA93_38770 [Streptosporangiaceae bacterium]
MIDKIRKGRDTTGLLRYLYGPGKSDEHTDPHLVAAWRDDLPGLEPDLRRSGRRDFRRLVGALDMPLTMTGRHGQDDTVWHCVLAASPADPLMPDEQWNTMAAEFMDAMGLAKEDDPAGVRWVAVRHGLSSGGIDHVHLVVTLARQDGGIPSVHNDFLRARRACRQIEQRHHLTDTAPADRTAAPRPSRAETERSARTGSPEPPRFTLRRLAQEAAAAALSEDDFFGWLRDAGALIRFRYSDRNPGEITGYTVALPGHVTKDGNVVWFSGGKLAPDLTVPKLRRRWDHPSDLPRGQCMSARSAKAFLRSAACSAAERSDGETGYFAALSAAGIQVRYRYNDHNPGQLTGYALRLLGADGQSAWHGGGQLAVNLSLPRLWVRWSAPHGRFRPPVTPAEHQSIWNDVVTAASRAAEQMRDQIQADPSAAADAAWATADLMRAAARAIRSPAARDLYRAAGEFDRAVRTARIVVPRPSPPGDALRTAAQLLSIIRPRRTARRIQALITILSDLAVATAELHAIRQHQHQAAAARTAHATLTHLGGQSGGERNAATRHFCVPERSASVIAATDQAADPSDPPAVDGRQATGLGRQHPPSPIHHQPRGSAP